VRDCTLTASGHEYVGQTAVTVSGKTCQAWSSQTPQRHSFVKDNLFPDGSVTAAGNYCRNPENTNDGLWCYTTYKDIRWERCDVPACGQSTHLVNYPWGMHDKF